MGFNTTVFILNDAFHEAVKDPENFVQGISHGMHGGGDFSLGGYCNYFTVMPTEHADVSRLYFTHGNSIVELSAWSRKTKETFENPYALDFLKQSIKTAKDMIKGLEKEIREYESTQEPAP